MEQIIDVKGKQYRLVTEFKHKSELRHSFNELTKKTYGFDFEQWYLEGYWEEKYLPYSLLDGDKVIANVSVNIMDFSVFGEPKRYIQIGTVMTDHDYRQQGLSRLLMEVIIKEWEEKCDLIYLYANDSVTDFYPKFGFVPTQEFQYSKHVSNRDSKNLARKIDVDNKNDKELLFNIVSQSVTYSSVAMLNNPYLVMFYAISFLKDNIYYLSDNKVIVVAEISHETVYIQDVFSTEKIPLDRIIDGIININTEKVILGFVPEEIDSFEKALLIEEDTTLFVKAIKSELPSDCRFPILSHA